jgi:hypothetical protein
VEISGYTLSTPSPLDVSAQITPTRTHVILDRTHDDIGADKIKFTKKSTIANFRINIPTTPRLRSEYYITFPDGSVREYTFS